MMISLLLMLVQPGQSGWVMYPPQIESCPPASVSYEACIEQCDQGDAMACRDLGNALNRVEPDGTWVPVNQVDPEWRASRLERGCELGDARSCNLRVAYQRFLGEQIYGDGQIHPLSRYRLPDLSMDEVAALTQRACKLNPRDECAEAGYNALHVSEEALGSLTQDVHARIAYRMDVALPSLQIACDDEVGLACTHIGDTLLNAYLVGMAVALDEAKAALQRGCDLQATLACRYLSDINRLDAIGVFDPNGPRDFAPPSCNPVTSYCELEDGYHVVTPYHAVQLIEQRRTARPSDP